MSISIDDMASLARALLDADEKVADAEQALKDAKERSRLLREETIPSAMQELGVESIKLDTGQKVEVKQNVYASIPKGNKDSAFTWLNDNGFGGMIKLTVDTTFGKGEQEKAIELYEALQRQGLDVSIDQDVHAQTLRAFIREQLATGKNFPLDLFGARPVWEAKISNK